MSFNRGWFCPKCGPVESAKDKSIAKVKYKVCKLCEAIVQPWKRPMKDRDGRCCFCGNGSFTLMFRNRVLLRECKKCKGVINPDTKEVIENGIDETL